MASFIRGKQAGMQNDLSAGVLPALFEPAEQARFGVGSQIACLAYDPVQSLLAVGTTQTRFGAGTIYVYGRDRVSLTIRPRGGAALRQLQFSAGRLVSLDAKSELALWDLDTGARTGGSVAAGAAVCMATDPMLDWAFLGLTTGDIVAYDLDRDRLAPLRVPNLWKQHQAASAAGQGPPRPRGLAAAAATQHLVCLQLHPRDVGKLLVGYGAGAVIYSFKQNAATRVFEYVVPAGAPGGNGEDPAAERRPRLTHALWHPSGQFVLTAHDDGSLVFWDAKDGRVVLARTLYDARVDQPGSASAASAPRVLDPIVQIAWCCKANADDTALLVAGGQAYDAPEKGLSFVELGPAPVYATASWQTLADHFEGKGKRQHVLPTPPGTDVTGFCLAPRASPHFAGAHDPLAVFVLVHSGELLTLSFPSGYPISPTNQLHPSLTFVSPFVSALGLTAMPRERWLGLTEKRRLGEPLLKGGAPAPRPRRRYERRNIIATAHADGTVRAWDAGHGDELENPALLQADVARALGRDTGVDICAVALAAGTGELAAGTRAGEVALFRWGTNRAFDKGKGAVDLPPLASNPGAFTDISGRGEDALQDGLQPWLRYEMLQGAVTALKVSDVGFVAVGSANGFLSIVDLRGPAVVFHGAIADFARAERRSFLGKHAAPSASASAAAAAAAKDYPTTIEFAVLTLDGKAYSSLVCLVGTAGGKLCTFELLPAGARYTATLAGCVDYKDPVVALAPIVSETGAPAAATGDAVAGLRAGRHVHGVVVVVLQKEARIVRPAAGKGASKSFDDVFCYAAAVVHLEQHGVALVGVFGDRTVRAFSLPGLKELGKTAVPQLDPTRLAEARISPAGDVYGWTGPSELVAISVWGHNAGYRPEDLPPDTLVNPAFATPPRPTISNLQWIAGTQYVSPTDLDILIGGPDRPPSQRMLAAAAAEARAARHGPSSGAADLPRHTAATEGWGAYLSRQINQRTESLGAMGDGVANLQESTQGWADDVSKYVARQKRGLVLGAVKSKFT